MSISKSVSLEEKEKFQIAIDKDTHSLSVNGKNAIVKQSFEVRQHVSSVSNKRLQLCSIIDLHTFLLQLSSFDKPLEISGSGKGVAFGQVSLRFQRKAPFRSNTRTTVKLSRPMSPSIVLKK